LLRGETAGQLVGVRNWVELRASISPRSRPTIPPPSLSHNLRFQSSPKEKYSRLWLVYLFNNAYHYRSLHIVIIQ
jgi:hypothetical protein